MTDKTCEERVQSHLDSRIEDLKDMFYSDDEEKREDFYNYGLCFDYVELGTFDDQKEDYYRYQISWGGPSDEFRFFNDGRIEYWFLDWFDGAHRVLSGDDYSLMEDIKQSFQEIGSIDWYTHREDSDYYSLMAEIEEN